MRSSIVAGQFYPADSEELKKEVMTYLRKAEIINVADKEKCFGVVVPHAGYTYSAGCAAFGYKSIRDEGEETFILLGVNHSGQGMANFAVSFDDFSSPLGIVKNDKEFSKEIVKLGNVEHNETSHKYEHSIEVQLPFLQCIKKRHELKIVPIIILSRNYEQIKKLAQDIVKISRKLKRKIKIVASSDFTHYGAMYGFLPFTPEHAKTKLKEIDMKAIEMIEKLDSRNFLDFASKVTICGSSAIATCIEICKLLGCKKGKLLKYNSSAEVSGDYSNVVGYASIIFR